MADKRQILWVDDEIEMLRAHIIYLGDRGYEVTSSTNGPDAIEMLADCHFDLALIDEMMPVMDGLELLQRLKEVRPDLPAVMVTKSEAEELMDQAIGSRIDGYLIKPVSPSQVLSIVKGILDRKQLSEAQYSRGIAERFAELNNILSDGPDAAGWIDLHNRLCAWELEIDRFGYSDVAGTVADIRSEADSAFARWFESDYQQWIRGDSKDRPPLSIDVIDNWLLPLLKDERPTLFLLVDCFRLDQWLMLEPLLSDYFDINRGGYFSIIPSATPYARNAVFSGLTPAEIERIHPDLWSRGDEDEASSNRFERSFLLDFLDRRGLSIKPDPKYIKVVDVDEGTEFERRVHEYINLPLTVLVYNFFDILIHTRQSVEVLQEMLPDESALRSVTRAWFQHSSLFRTLKAYGEAGANVLLTTDHGSIRVKRGSKVIGDRHASTSLRYKHGRNLKSEKRHSLKIMNPSDWGLPSRGINTDYIIAREDFMFLYPTNYNRYLDMYRSSFQHGGISLNEMVLPVVTMRGKGG